MTSQFDLTDGRPRSRAPRKGYRSFAFWTVTIIVAAAVLSVALGVLVFALNSFREPQPLDLDGPSGVAAVIPSLAGVVIAALAVYFYIRAEDPVRRESFEIYSHLQKINQSVLIYVRALIQIHAVSKETSLVILKEVNDDLLSAIKSAIHETRAFTVVNQLYQAEGDPEGSRQLSKIYMQLIDAKHAIGKDRPQVIDLHQLDKLRHVLRNVSESLVYDLLYRQGEDLLDWEREAFGIMIARSEGADAPSLQ